jgi:hypothetical protein
MTYTPMQLPYIDGLLMEVLREALGSTASVGTVQPSDVLLRLPYVVAASFGGDATDIRFALRPDVQIDCYAATRPAAASLAETCRIALVAGWLNATPYTAGRLGRVWVTSAPAELELPDGPAGLVRWHTLYRLVVRPAPPVTP